MLKEEEGGGGVCLCRCKFGKHVFIFFPDSLHPAVLQI